VGVCMADESKGITGQPSLSIEQLIALNEEIAALCRAGLPLAQGLRAVGLDSRGTLRSTFLSLAQKMEQGMSLTEALETERNQFPPVYLAIVEAGLSAGRLPLALEHIASFVSEYAETRRVIGLALWYPLVVLTLAYTLFIGLVVWVVPRFITMFQSFRMEIPIGLWGLEKAGEWAMVWGAVLPLIVLWFFVGWKLQSRARRFPNRDHWSWRWLPWMRGLIEQSEAASLAQLLAVLIEHGVPYPRAVVLAADASGDPELKSTSREIAAALTQGDLNSVNWRTKRFPPMIRWALLTGHDQPQLSLSLRRIGDLYHKRASFQAEKIRYVLPSLLLIAIGMTATLLYGLSLYYPFVKLLEGLALPPI